MAALLIFAAYTQLTMISSIPSARHAMLNRQELVLSLKRHSRPGGLRGFRPALESLESRHVPSTVYLQNNLISDIPGVAAFTDANLVNPWGIVASPNGPFWINDNGAGVSTLYDGNGNSIPASSPLVVTVPLPPGSTAANSSPTGIVFNNTADFALAPGNNSSAVFIFATEDGTISGWNPTVNATNAILKVDNSTVPTAVNGAVYKGLALGSNATGNFLFAANFRSGAIDVFDKDFRAATLTGNFTDPNLPAGFAPFDIANMSGQLFVTYAKQNAAKHDDVAGPGNGFIDVFDTNGNFVKRFASQGNLNSPWGMAMAPSTFGQFAGDLLIGNFGDGRINAFNPANGAFQGQLQSATGTPLAINGLWGLDFGNGIGAGSQNTLFFTAGIGDEGHGLFGSLTPATANQAFLAKIFPALLNRPLDGFGNGFFSNMLAQGASRAQVALAIEGTTEYHSLEVQNLFQTYLHRAPDLGGLTAFTATLDAGGTITQVREALTSSAEYFQTRAGSNNDNFLTALFQDALNRQVDAATRMALDQFLASGGTRTAVAAFVFTSDEFHQDLVSADYQQFLKRASDPGGLAAFTHLLDQGAREESVIASLLGSDEFFNSL
jgi:uncharacterized protein (TIGR03118 family)